MRYHVDRAGIVVMVTFLMGGCAGSPTPSGNTGTMQIEKDSNITVKASAEEAFRQARFDEAAQLFAMQARAGGQDEHKAWFNAGAAYWNAGQKTQALEAYEQSVAVNPLYLKGHLRLTNKYAVLKQAEPSAKHKKYAVTIQGVTKKMMPFWDKANAMRAQGVDWYEAAATIHEGAAELYQQQGLPDCAEAERKQAEQSRMEGQVALAKSLTAKQDAKSEVAQAAFRAELVGSVKDLVALSTKVDPTNPYSLNAGGSSGARSAIAGLGVAEQALGGYAGMMQAFEGRLNEQRAAMRQQGQQAQTALADPTQAQTQRMAQQRTMELQQRLQEMERLATAKLAEEGLLDDSESQSNLDGLDI